MSELIESVKLAGLLFVLPGLALALVAFIGDRWLEARYRRNLTPTVTPHDFDDWREPIREFRAEQYIRAIRRRFAVTTVCGADPETKAAPARVTSPGATTPSKETTHARSTSK